MGVLTVPLNKQAPVSFNNTFFKNCCILEPIHSQPELDALMGFLQMLFEVPWAVVD